MADVTLKQIAEFFGMTSKEMMKEWRALTDSDKAEIKELVAAEI